MIETVIEIAKEAGDILMKYYKGDYEVKSKDKDRFNPVTTADLESDEHIRKRLKEAFPGDEILTEENEVEIKDFSKRVWIVDPLDGTHPFTEHHTGFAVLIGLCENGEPTLGVLYAPALKELYYAEKGKGAFLEKDGKKTKLKVSSIDKLEEARFQISGLYSQGGAFKEWKDSLNVKERVNPKGECYSMKTAALVGKLSDFLVASPDLMKWDACASQIIITEAGGVTTLASGKSLDYKQESSNFSRYIVASNGNLHKKLIEMLEPFKDATQKI